MKNSVHKLSVANNEKTAWFTELDFNLSQKANNDCPYDQRKKTLTHVKTCKELGLCLSFSSHAVSCFLLSQYPL